MGLDGRRISILGAGVAGLASAVAAARRGAEVTLFEQAPALEPVGAGLQVAPNGHRVLAALGLAEAVAADAVRIRAIRLIDGRTGRPVTTLDLARHAPDRTFLALRRATLVDHLAAAARNAGARLALGHHAAPDDPDLPGDLVLAADGVKSRGRDLLNGPEAPEFTGQVAWRALVPEAPDPAPEVEVWMGPGRHLVTYPLGGDRRNIVAVEERGTWTAEGWHHRDDPAALRAAFAGFAPRARDLLAAVDDVHLWGLFRRPVVSVWGAGRLALVGDAAHPTLPFLAQGANLALEDAWVLTEALDRHAPEAAFARYAALRAPRVRRAIRAAERNAGNYHLRGPVALVGHGVMRGLSAVAPAAPLRRFDWLYGHDVTRAAV